MTHTLRPLLLLTLCGSTLGCSGSDPSEQPDSGEVDGGVVFSCDPASATSCSAGSRCDALCDGGVLVVGCRAQTPQDQDLGAPCSPSAPCKAGSTCLANPGAASICTKFCTATAECGAQSCAGVTAAYRCSAAPTTTSVTLQICR